MRELNEARPLFGRSQSGWRYSSSRPCEPKPESRAPGRVKLVPDIVVSSTGPREFQVTVRDRGSETSHGVTVPERLIEELGLAEDDLERVVRESFEFLLEREPPSSIMAEFSLDVISRYFPQYEEELPRRLS